MADTQKHPLTQAYETQIALNHWHDDQTQRAIIDAFQSLYNELLNVKAKKPTLLSFFKTKSSGGNHVKGIYLWGDVGRGKSMIMDMFFDIISPNIQAKRFHFHAFMTLIHEELYRYQQQSPDGDPLPKIAKDFAQSCKLLCLDEFQVHDIADAMILSRLFASLLNNGIVTVTTSNRPPEDLYKNGLQRDSFLPFITLINQHFNVLTLNHETDYRLQKLSETDVYFTPKNNVKPLENLFAQMRQHEPKPTTLRIKGRDLLLP